MGRNMLTSIFTACTRRKPLEISSDMNTSLDRCLTTLDMTFLGIGSTLGAGIYVLTGEVAKDKAGPAVILSFLVAAVASILSGFCYAEFGARFPKAGSAYAYCYVAIGEFVAFFIGWNVIMEYIIGGSAIAKGASKYIDSLAHGVIENTTVALSGEIHVYGLSNYFDFFSVVIVALVSVILALGMKNSSRLNNFLVFLNITTITVVTIVGFAYADGNNWSNFAPYGFRGIIRGAATCFFAFIGFDVIATTGEEAKNPGRSIPFSILGTITICFCAYLGVSAAITLMVPYYDLDKNAAVSTAFGQRGLHFMTYVVGMGAAIGLLGCTLVSLVAPPRLLYAMSADGLLPGMFSRVNEKTNTPLVGTIISGILIALMAAILDLDALVEMLSIGTLLAYSIVDISVLVLRYRPRELVEVPTVEVLPEHSTTNPFLSPDSSRDGGARDGGAGGFWSRVHRLQRSPLVVNAVIIAIIVEIFGACIILDKFSDKLLVERDAVHVTLWVVLVLSIVGNGIFLQKLPAHVEESVSFKVPLVPWIPIAALVFNVSLILELGYLTWVRFGAWMGLGVIVYFGFSMRHSVEARDPAGYTAVQTSEGEVRKLDDKESFIATSEKVPLIARNTKDDFD